MCHGSMDPQLATANPSEEECALPKDVDWKSLGGGGAQEWKKMSGAVAALVARQIAEGRANKKSKKKDKKKK